MNKVWVFLALVLLASPVFGAQIQTELIDETLSRTAGTDTGWHSAWIESGDKVTFFVTMDSSSTTDAVTAEVTAQVSVDGSNWTDVRWFDFAGGTTNQVTETIDGDGTYIMWLERNANFPHVRIKVLTTASEKWPSDSAAMTVTLVENK